MIVALVKRLLSLILVLFMIFAGTRALVRALPGDPLETLMAESGTSLSAEYLRNELGLDRPFLSAMMHDLKKALHGDFGISLISRKPIGSILSTRLQKTVQLTFTSLILGLLMSLTLGLSAAAKPGSGIDRFCTLHGALSAALPTPWVCAAFLISFAVWIPLFPSGGHWFLPSLTLATSYSGVWARLIRERVREMLIRGSAPGARARGIPEWKVILKYGLAPASGVLVAYLGTQVGSMLSGVFVTEIIFDWQGMGMLLINAVLSRDYPIVESATFIAASLCLASNTLGDCAEYLVNPKSPVGP